MDAFEALARGYASDDDPQLPSEYCCFGCKETMVRGGQWHRCHKCGQPVHSWPQCDFVYQGEQDDQHVCHTCHQGGADKGKGRASPVPALSIPVSPSRVQGAQALLHLHGDAGGSVKPPSSQHDTQPFKSRPFIAPTAPPRPHLRHTPRPDSELLEPPAEGSAWTWNPEIVNADGANAAPNAVRNACQEENSEHSILRGHCSVHQQRLIQQNKYQIFPGVDRAEAMQMAEQLSAWMESVKCHSTSAATAH